MKKVLPYLQLASLPENPTSETPSACSTQYFKNLFLIKWTGGFSQQELQSKQTQWELGLVVADGVVFVPL